MLVQKQTKTSYDIKNISVSKLKVILDALTKLTAKCDNQMANDMIISIKRSTTQLQ